jgi:hypothetical protein
MPFSPWKEHVPEDGACTLCGIPIPKEAISVNEGRARAYSHTYVTGEPVFCQQPKGRSVPCHSEKRS